MKGISTGSLPYAISSLPFSMTQAVINDTKSNSVFPFPASLSVSVGVMLTPVARDLAFLMTPSYQVLFRYFYF